MANTTNTLYIVIDPSGAKSGANAAVQAMNSVTAAGNGINVTINNVTKNLKGSGKAAENFFSKFSLGLKAIAGGYALHQISDVFTSFIHEITRVDRVYNGFIAMLNTTTRDISKSREEFDYVAQTARAYGVSLEYLIRNYAKLRAATVHIMTEDETKRLFESFTAVSSVLHAEEITVERIYNAIIQMASKGQIHMEELKQQLGEHLPGALAIAATALNMNMADMIEAMQKGEISARELLIPLPQVLMDRFAEAAEITSKSLHATFMNLRTSFFKAFKEMSTNGVALGLSEVLRSIQVHVDTNSESFKVFGEIVGQALMNLADFLKNLSPQAVAQFTTDMLKLVKAFVDFLQMTASATIALAEHKDEVWLVIQAYIGYRVVGTTVAAVNAGIIASSGLAAGALTMLKGVLLSLVSAAAGWQFGTYLREKFAVVEQAGIALAAGLHKAAVAIVTAWDWAKERLTGALGGMSNAYRSWAIMQQKRWESVPEDSPLKGFAEWMTPKNIPDYVEVVAPQSLDDRLKSRFAELDSIYSDMFAQAGKRDRGDTASNAPTVMERLGLSEQQFDDAQSLMDRFNQLKTEADSAFDTQGHSKRGQVTAYQGAANDATEILNRYKETVEQLKFLNEEHKISTSQMINAQIEALNQRTDAAIKVLESAKVSAKTPKELEQINALIEKYQSQRLRTVTKLQTEELTASRKFNEDLRDMEADFAGRRLTAVEKFTRDWNDKAEPILIEAKLNGDEEVIAKIEALKQKGLETAKNIDLGIDVSGAVQSATDQLKKLNPEMEHTKALQSEISRLYSDISTNVTNLTVRYEVLNSAFEAGAISQEYFTNQIAQTNVELATMLNKLGMVGEGFNQLELIGVQALGHVLDGFVSVNHSIGDIMGTALNDWVDGLADSIAGAVVNGEDLRETLGNIARQILTQLIASFIKLGIQMVVNKLLGDTLLAASLASQGAAAAATASMWAPAASMVSLATMGSNAVPAQAGIASTNAMASALATSSFEGGGYTGEGPRTGGIDGRGGFLAMVHPNETIIDHEMSKAKKRPMLDAMQSGKAFMDNPEAKQNQANQQQVQPAPEPVKNDTNIRIVNAFDTAIIGDYLNSEAGEEMVMNVVTRNQSTVKSMVF